MRDLLMSLCRLNGVSGSEDEVRSFLVKEVKPYADLVRTDGIGNLIVEKRGAAQPKKKILLCAHMDECGLMVRSVTDEGFLKFALVGKINPAGVPGKAVLVGSRAVPGVIGSKAVHLTSADERKTPLKIKDLYLDIGARNKAGAEQNCAPGDVCAFLTEPSVFGRDLLKAKAIASRAGCAVLVNLIRSKIPCDCTFVFTAQREVGARGAFGAAFSVKPDIALVLDGADSFCPAPDGTETGCVLGKGPVIPFMDERVIFDRALADLLRSLAKENGIPWQTCLPEGGKTDAWAVQTTRGGVRTAGLCLPVRYPRSPVETACVQDAEHMLTLAGKFLVRISED